MYRPIQWKARLNWIKNIYLNLKKVSSWMKYKRLAFSNK